MEQLPNTIVLTILVLTAFFIGIVALKYSTLSNFSRTRLMMTAFFAFIVVTLTISFWHYTLQTLPYTIPAFIVGAILGQVVGVRAAESRLSAEGTVEYMEHFAHIHQTHLKRLTWWSLVNFYSVMGALVLINLVGASTVLFKQDMPLILFTCVVGALLLGSIVPYLIHLWSITAAHASSKMTSESKNI